MEQKIHRVGFEIRKLDQAISRNLAAEVSAAGIDEMTLMHSWIIRYLYRNRDKEIYHKDIEKHFSIGRSTVTSIVQLLEKRGYICRESVSCDARLKKVVLTQKGIESHEAVESIISMVNAGMLEGIDEDELAVFFKVARKIRENLERQQTDGGKEETNGQNIVERSKGV